MSTRHGFYGHKLYKLWVTIKTRCYNNKTPYWKNYGGRGIELCPAWHEPKKFIRWALNNGWQEGLEIDRRNNDGGYSPDNCRFVSRIVNQSNKRNTRCVVFKGKRMLYKEVFSLYAHNDLRWGTFLTWLKKKWDLERALFQAPQVQKH